MNSKIKTPLVIAVSVIAGLLIGNFYALVNTKGVVSKILNSNSISLGRGSKIDQLLNMIDKQYVDTVDVKKMEEAVIPTILAQLDPHSSYITSDELQDVNDELAGSFSGIGVQFTLQNDTIYIVDVISGGPAEKVGMMDGDRIVKVNDTVFVGKEVTNEKVLRKLKGPKGSSVEVEVARRSSTKPLKFEITRGDIPVHSMDIAYMVTPSIGLISINKFAANTYNEFLTGLAKLREQKMKQLIIDLRGNAGGYMDAAINMLNELLDANDIIVYIQGKAYPRYDYVADGNGTFKQIPVVVLIDEFSGSASEIFAGAIQDNDRGTIIGRRSFGKGLVQTQFDFKDHSAVRLTIARYYTPSGRCIQKHYEKGKTDDYASDIYNRYLHGEFFSKDSIKQVDTVSYKTKNGRTVYGGGGIMPDIFVPRDTLDWTPFYNDVANQGLIYQFALNFTEKHRNMIHKKMLWREAEAKLKQQDIYNEFLTYVKAKGVKINAAQAAKSRRVLESQIIALIARNTIGDEAFFPILLKNDPTVNKAIQVLSKTK